MEMVFLPDNSLVILPCRFVPRIGWLYNDDSRVSSLSLSLSLSVGLSLSALALALSLSRARAHARSLSGESAFSVGMYEKN
jgi:hypothetical protein